MTIVGFVLALVVLIIIAGLPLADAISTELVAAAVLGAGFIVLLMLFTVINMIGKRD
jgi:hypothetical protein